VANDAKWKQKQITVKGSAFPTAGYYLISVTSLAKGSPSDNLFTASVFLAGTADMGLARAH